MAIRSCSGQRQSGLQPDLYKKPLFNSVTDFTPVALLTEQSLVLMARKDLPGEGLQDFMRHVKASKTASFGSAGAGSSTHLGCVMLNLAIGVDATHVPYRGNGPAMQDLIGGRIDYYCDLIQTRCRRCKPEPSRRSRSFRLRARRCSPISDCR